MEQSPISVMITGVQRVVEHVNPAFCDMTGYRRDEVRGQNPRIPSSAEPRSSRFTEPWLTILKGEVCKGELRNRRKNRALCWAAASIAPGGDAAPTAALELPASLERLQSLLED